MVNIDYNVKNALNDTKILARFNSIGENNFKSQKAERGSECEMIEDAIRVMFGIR